MKSPFTGKKMVKEQEMRVIKYLNEEVEYLHKYYRCVSTDIQFTTTELDEGNLRRVHKSYNKTKEKGSN